jgi:hypothetical protein
LKTAIEILPIGHGGELLLLQHASGMVLSGSGVLTRYETPMSAPTTIATCFNRPTSMALDKKSGAIFITELVEGRLVRVD